MSIIFKGLVVATLLLTAGGAHAQDAVEARMLAQWPKLAQRSDHQLMIMNHGGGEFSTSASVFVDGQGPCASYLFTGVQKLFDTYTRRLEPVAELTCVTAEGSQHALVRGDGTLITSAAGLTASADGHYVFIEQQHEHSEDDQGKPVDYGMEPSIRTWTASGGAGPYALACTHSRPDGASDFRATCAEPNGHTFEARFADARPEKRSYYKAWKVYNLDDPSDAKSYLNPIIMLSVSNEGDRFNLATDETKALADHPGLVRRDGPALVLLDGGRDAGRISDEGRCDYWFLGKSADLYDARKGVKAPVAEIWCHRGEFGARLLAPAYAPSLNAGYDYAASEDGKTVIIQGNAASIIDWQSRKVLLTYAKYCRDMAARGNDHFSASCEGPEKNGHTTQITVNFDRDAAGTWVVAEPAKD